MNRSSPPGAEAYLVLVLGQVGPGPGGEVLIDQGESFRFTRLSLGAAGDRRRVRSSDCVVLEGGRLEVLDALDELRRTDAAVPVVVVATDPSGEWAVEALSSGAQDVLDGGELDAALLARSIRYAVQRQRAEQAGRELREARILRDEQARLERGLAPTPLLADPELRWGAAYRSGGGRRLLGGDFFDVVQVVDGRLRLVVGDVCGHGPDEAALGVALRVAWRSLVLAGADEDATVAGLDALLRAERPVDRPVFTTLCDVTVAADRASLTFRLAGHQPPMLAHPRVELWEAPASPPLGLSTSVLPVPSHHRALPPGWALLLHSDGLVEIHLDDGSLLGAEGLRDLVVRHPPHRDLDGWAAGMVNEVEGLSARPLRDDRALVVLCNDTEAEVGRTDGRGGAHG
jgi:serine phosphatase RsbU (regulator of sigma subunit)